MIIPGTASDWHGCERRDFAIDGIQAILVLPQGGFAPGRPWYWRARFFGAFPDGDFAMLKLGWAVAHINIDELYGSPESNRRFDLLYDYLTRELGMSPRPVLVGYSRGGLDVYSWAKLHPDRVGCLYLDNPVCDFKSWPGGKGKGPGDPEAWRNCLRAWNFTEEQALRYPGNPMDDLGPLPARRTPILHLCGDADEVVPAEENTMLLEKRCRALGGNIEVIYKPGAKHHPHCLSDPRPIVDFILRNVR